MNTNCTDSDCPEGNLKPWDCGSDYCEVCGAGENNFNSN